MSIKYLLEVKNLTVNFHLYQGILSAVDNISFGILPLETYGLVGESGSGKTVSALAILKLILTPGRIESGRVFFDGTEISALPDRDFRKLRGSGISMVFQQSRTALNPFKKIGDQVGRVYRVHDKMSKKDAKEKAIESLKRVRIPEAEKRVESYPHEFSLGMAQRVMIGMMIACKPKLLIADEPTTGLDVTTQAQILDLMNETKKSLGMSILLITHDMGVAAQTCDKIAVMHAGHIVEIADAVELYENPQHPYTQGLLKAIPRVDKRIRIEDIPGGVPNLIDPPKGCRFVNRCPKSIEGLCTNTKPKMIETRKGHIVMCHLYGV